MWSSPVPASDSAREENCTSSWDSLKDAARVPESLTHFRKDFYRQHADVTSRSDKEVETYKKANEIHTANSAIRPVTRLCESSLPDDLISVMERAGFTAPTPIQSVCWPIALSGKDIVGIAQTGSGKTLSFILPAVVHIRDQPPLKVRCRQKGDGPIAVILSPTRELAQQTTEACVKFGRCTLRESGCGRDNNIYVASIYGGAGRRGQEQELQAGVHMVVATPGRLLDFLSSLTTNMKRVTFLVLDEADRMLDMGFEPQIRKVVSQMRSDRQTLMLSATWPREVQQLASSFQRSPEHVRVGSSELTANAQIEQRIEFVEEYGKFDLLLGILKSISRERASKVVIFMETKRGCENLSSQLREKRWPVSAIHGDKSQRDREEILAAFRSGTCRVLIATDVASRGLDVKDISHVINYDLPKQVEDYIHRIGRTARAGAKGIAISFFTARDARLARDIETVLRDSNQTVPRELREMASDRRVEGGGRSRSPRHRNY